MKNAPIPHKAKKLKATPKSAGQTSVPTNLTPVVVGIGASAGGLEALGAFLGNTPIDTGMAFVIIQHLDPTHKGIMPELLQRMTKMKVVQVKDRLKVQPNCVYVIPAKKSMSILGGALHLFEPLEDRGLRLPIDFFFRSLADDLRERSVGIILSGMGSDGSVGLKAIKEKGGVTMAQDPTSAKFDGMPRSAISGTLVDIIGPAHELPGKLISILQHFSTNKTTPELAIKESSAIEKIIILLRSHTGQDFSLYKKNTLYRRIERRMSIHQITKINSYVHLLQENPHEITILFKELLIGVTSFFRDNEVWKHLKNNVIPAMLAERRHGSVLRAWVPGCATGEEAYSLAIAFKEAMENTGKKTGISLQIFATDIDNDSIEEGRKGVFKENISADVSPSQLARFFVQTEAGYRVNAEIREMVIFATHNVIQDPPFTKLDLLSCRNLLIYLENELQKKLLSLFHYSLNPGGILMLGNAETIGQQTNIFTSLAPKLKIYRNSGSFEEDKLLDFPSSFVRPKLNMIELPRPAKVAENIQVLADQLILQSFAPPGVLINDKGDILYISGRTGKYLEPATGRANWNIFAMAREGLRVELPGACRKAVSLNRALILHNLHVNIDGKKQAVNITITTVPQILMRTTISMDDY